MGDRMQTWFRFVLLFLILPLLGINGCPTRNEACDGRDNDGDGQTDEGFDADGDGYLEVEACSAAYPLEQLDCNDVDPAVHPDAAELCDTIDNDCDGLIDDADPSVTGQSEWYADVDGDGYGNASSPSMACGHPAGYTSNSTDCDDSDAALKPDTVWTLDLDEDGYGDMYQDAVAVECEQPSEYVLDHTDCDDDAGEVHPGALEYPGDGLDNDCDGLESDVLQIGGGGYHSLSLFEDGNAQAWGNNSQGQLGHVTWTPQAVMWGL